MQPSPSIFLHATMDRRTALALRQAYRRDAALLLQSPAVPSSGVCTSSGLSTQTSSKGVDDVLKANQPQTKYEETASAAAASSPFMPPSQDTTTKSPFMPPSQDTTTKCKHTAGDGESALHTLDLAGIGRNLVLRSSREFPPPPLKGRRGTTAVNSGVDDGQLRPEHYCAPCGNLFYSKGNATVPANTCNEETGVGIGSSGIEMMTVVRVRSIARGRTRRRRAARVRARQAALDAAQRKGRDGGRQWGEDGKFAHGSSAGQPADGGAAGSGRAGGGHGHAVATYTQADIERRKANAQLYNVQDGTKHHCVVYTCGHCGNKTRLGGIDVATRERRCKGNMQDHQKNESRGSTSTHQRKKHLSKERGANDKAHISTGRSEQKNLQSNAIGGDFISLVPLSPEEPSKKQEAQEKANKKASSYSDKATQSKKAASASRLDQSSNRKRKKSGGSGAGSLSAGGKKNAGKKSKLMDFLSSLNG